MRSFSGRRRRDCLVRGRPSTRRKWEGRKWDERDGVSFLPRGRSKKKKKKLDRETVAVEKVVAGGGGQEGGGKKTRIKDDRGQALPFCIAFCGVERKLFILVYSLR